MHVQRAKEAAQQQAAKTGANTAAKVRSYSYKVVLHKGSGMNVLPVD